jgi:hypothetical protein
LVWLAPIQGGCRIMQFTVGERLHEDGRCWTTPREHNHHHLPTPVPDDDAIHPCAERERGATATVP